MEGAKYSGGCPVQWRVPSTVEGYLVVQWGGGYHEVQWRVQVRWMATMQYSGGLSEVQWGAIMKNSGGCKYGGWLPCTVEGYLKYSGGAIMKYSGGCKYGGGLCLLLRSSTVKYL